jgi:hypothetical protein
LESSFSFAGSTRYHLVLSIAPPRASGPRSAFIQRSLPIIVAATDSVWPSTSTVAVCVAALVA